MKCNLEFATSNAVAAARADRRGDCAARDRLKFEAVTTYAWCGRKQWGRLYDLACRAV